MLFWILTIWLFCSALNLIPCLVGLCYLAIDVKESGEGISLALLIQVLMGTVGIVIFGPFGTMFILKFFFDEWADEIVLFKKKSG